MKVVGADNRMRGSLESLSFHVSQTSFSESVTIHKNFLKTNIVFSYQFLKISLFERDR